MKLIIKDYILTLKEEIELENLLENLLILMEHIIISSPTKGVRQNGRDLESKKDDKDYIFIIKQKDIDRRAWNVEVNSVRQTLEEILDLGVKAGTQIIVVTNGNIKQNVREQFYSYLEKNSKNYNINILFWNIDKLVQLVEKYLINENIFTDEVKELFRKSFIFIAESDNKLSKKYFSSLVELLLKEEITKKRELNKLIQTSNLILNIMLNWCEKEDNIRPMLFCADIMLLRILKYKNKFEKNFKKNNVTLDSLLSTVLKIYKKFIMKLTDILNIEFGIVIGKTNSLLVKNEFWEFFKILITFITLNKIYKSDENQSKMITLLTNFLERNGLGIYSLMYPLYDDNIIEINLAMILLLETQKINTAKRFIKKVSENFFDRIYIKKIYPLFYRENYKKLIEDDLGTNKATDEKISTTILYNLFFWATYLSDECLYQNIYKSYMEIKDKVSINYELLSFKDDEKCIEVTSIGIPSGIKDFKKVHNQIIENEEIKDIGNELEYVLDSLLNRKPVKNKIFYTKL